MHKPTRHLVSGAAYAAASFAAVAAVGLTAGASEPRTVEFATTPAAPTVSAAEAMDAARAYAEAHGLTSCTAPAYAALDDVVLTVPADTASGLPTSTDVAPVTFTEALQSTDRRNLLACAGQP